MTARARAPGRASGRVAMWRLGGLRPRELAARVARNAAASDLGGRAAQLAFYFLFALFPLLLFLTTLFAFAISDSHAIQDRLLGAVARVLPSPQVVDLLHELLHEVISQRGHGKLSFGILAALWLASNGMAGVVRSLNASLGVRRLRAWWRRRLIALGLTVAFSLLAVVSLSLMLYGADIGARLRELLGIEQAFWNLVRWSAALAAAVVAFDTIYNAAALEDRYPRQWFTPGAVLAAAVWLSASAGLKLYVSLIDAYSRIYGSLGAMILLLTWFYLGAAALLLGGAIDAEICRAASTRGTVDDRSSVRPQAARRRPLRFRRTRPQPGSDQRPNVPERESRR